MNDFLKGQLDKAAAEIARCVEVASALPGQLQDIAHYLDGELVITVSGLYNLRRVRALLRESLGGWADALVYVGPNGPDKAYLTYTPEGYDYPVRLRVFCAREELPESIMKPGCGFKRVESNIEVFSCSVPE